MYRGELIQIRKEDEDNYIVRHREQGTFFIANKTEKIILENLDSGMLNEETSNFLQKEFKISEDVANWYINAALFNLLSMNQGSNLKFDFKSPIRVGWRLTEHCNLKCRHCYLSCGEGVKHKNLSLTECKEIVDKLCDGGIFEILLTGGEIFTRSDLKDIIDYIAMKKMDISLYSNAVLMEKNMKWLIEAPIRRFNISLDGLEEEHDYLRGKGNFAITINAIRKLVKNGKMVIINCVVNKKNVSKVSEIYEYLKKEGVGIQFSLITPTGRASLNEELIPEYEEFIDSMEKLQQSYNKNNDDNVIYNYYKKEIISLHKGKNIAANDNWKCNAGTTKFDIDVNGDVLICPFRQDTKIGNLLESTVKDVWDSKERENFNSYSKKHMGRLCKPVADTIKNDKISYKRLKQLLGE